jgi:hypothetical protein
MRVTLSRHLSRSSLGWAKHHVNQVRLYPKTRRSYFHYGFKKLGTFSPNSAFHAKSVPFSNFFCGKWHKMGGSTRSTFAVSRNRLYQVRFPLSLPLDLSTSRGPRGGPGWSAKCRCACSFDVHAAIAVNILILLESSSEHFCPHDHTRAPSSTDVGTAFRCAVPT